MSLWMSLNYRLERVCEVQIKNEIQPLCCCVFRARHYALQTTREKKPITCSVSLVVDSIWRMQTEPVCPEGTGYFHRMRGIKAKRKFNKQLKHPTYKTISTFKKVNKRSLFFLFQFTFLAFVIAQTDRKVFPNKTNYRRFIINDRSRLVFLSKRILTVINVIFFSFTPKSLLTMGEKFVHGNKRRDLMISVYRWEWKAGLFLLQAQGVQWPSSTAWLEITAEGGKLLLAPGYVGLSHH